MIFQYCASMLLINLLYLQCGYAQMNCESRINYLSKERTPAVIIDYLVGKKHSRFEIQIVDELPNVYGDEDNPVNLIYKKSGSGYLYINQTIESSLSPSDARDVEYFLNGEVVNTDSKIRRLIMLKKKHITSFHLDDSGIMSVVKVYVETRN